MCNCVKNLEKEMIGRMVGNGTTKRKVTATSFKQKGIMFGKSVSAPTYSQIECTVEGQKKPYVQTIIHSFCPFCGEKVKKS